MLTATRIRPAFTVPRTAGLGRTESAKRQDRANWLTAQCKQVQTSLQAVVNNISTGRPGIKVTRPDPASRPASTFEGGGTAPAATAAAPVYTQTQLQTPAATAAAQPAAAAAAGGGGIASMLPFMALMFLLK